MLYMLLNINWEEIAKFLLLLDWILIIKIIFWVGIPYLFMVFSGIFYAFLKSKIWWDRGFFLYKIEKQIKNGIPIKYSENWDRYEMIYKGFYFLKFIFLKRDNDCRIIIEGDRTGLLFKLFEDSEINLNLDKSYDYNFYENILNHCEYIEPKQEYTYSVPWLKEEIEKYGSYKGN